MKKSTSILQWKLTMNVVLIRFYIALLGVFITPVLFAANLKNIDVISLSGEKVELKLVFDEPVAAPKGYTIDQPARIALDLPGVINKSGEKRRAVDIGNVRNLTIVEANSVTRLVVDLNTLVPYTTRVEANNVYVVLGDVAPVTKPTTAIAAITPKSTITTTTKPISTATTVTPPVKNNAPMKSVATTANDAIENIDFRRGDNGEGNIVIKLSNSKISPEVKEQGGKIVLNFPQTQLPDSLRVRLDVKDFATPVQFINSTARANGSTISIEPKGNYDYLVFQADNELTVSVKHVSATEKERQLNDQGVFKGETLSLNFQDIEVRSVLQILADFTKLNLVVTDSVTGNITLRLQNVPWDQALDIIMRTRGLAKRQEGNILIIAPADELAESARRMFDAEQTLKATQPLRRELIQINYADANDIVNLFKATMARSDGVMYGGNTSGQRGYAGNMVSDDRGSLTVDKRTNTIIANQTEERLEELRRVVAQLDRPVRQVQIEARIVEANVNFAKSLGVRWAADIGGGRVHSYGGGDGRKNNDTSSTSGGDFGNLGTSVAYDEATGYNVQRAAPMVDLGAAAATSGFGVGFLGRNIMIDLKINAMQKSGQGEVISQPKVTTSDKETAKIMKGEEIPYQEASSSGATTTSFKDAVLSLEVTPQITPDNQIIMAVTVTKDSVNRSGGLADRDIPPINKNEVNAKVLVSDGETIVLGGVFQNNQSKIVEKVPYLGDLPVVGRLFRRDTVNNEKQELLIFITPRIIDNKAFATRS